MDLMTSQPDITLVHAWKPTIPEHHTMSPSLKFLCHRSQSHDMEAIMNKAIRLIEHVLMLPRTFITPR